MKREFERITFSIPSRTFLIESYVSNNERLPIVTEFAIRVIRIVGELPVLALRQYLGISEQETAILLDELERQMLVEVRDELVSLTSYAVSHFEESSDELPRFSSIEKRPDRVDFELLTFSPVNGRDAPRHPGRSIVLEPTDGKALASSNRLAEAAYQTHFDRILQMKGSRDRKRLDLYKVTSVEADKNFYIPVPISFSIDEDGLPSRSAPDLGLDAPIDSINELDALISDRLQGHADSTLKDLVPQFCEYFDDKVLAQFCAKASFRWQEYIMANFESHEALYPEGTYPILGNLYVERNRLLIAGEIRSAALRAKTGTQCSGAFWMAPDNKLWGRTAEAKTAFDGFSRAIAHPPALHVILPESQIPSGAAPNVTFSQRTLYYRGGGQWRGRLELFVMAPHLAACLIHIPLAEAPGISVPVGFVTSDVFRVELARQALCDTVRGDGFVAPSSPIGKGARTVLSEEIYSCLDYVPVTLSGGGYRPLLASKGQT